MSKAHDAYLADWKQKHSNVVQPERPHSCPDMTNAQQLNGYRVWDNSSKCFELANGQVLEIGQTTNWMSIYAVFPNREAWDAYTQPMSFNEYFNG